MSGLTAAVGGGLGGSADWSIVDPASVAPGSTSLVGGMTTGSSDFLTPALPAGNAPMLSPYVQPTASTIVAPYGTPAASAQPALGFGQLSPNVAALNAATSGLASLNSSTTAGGAAGQDRVLYAHVAPTEGAKPAPPKEVEVKKGDTLSAIAKAHGTTWEKLYELNKDVVGGDPNLIKPGQKLKLP